MKYIGKPIDLEKYTLHDQIRKGLYEYRARNSELFKDRKKHNKLYLKRTIWTEDTHISEFLGFLLGRKNGFKVCESELYKAPLLNNKFDYGVISYEETSENDTLILPRSIIKDFLENQNSDKEIYNGVDIDTIMASIFFYMNENRRPYQEFLDFKQDFINMMLYDLKYMNPDRRLNNWFIREDKKTGQVDLYPMFDNEMILGFDYDLQGNRLSEESLDEEDSKRKSAVLLPKDFMLGKSESDYKEFMKYLLKKYPVQTQKAFNQVSNVTSQYLEEVLSDIEDIRKGRIERSVQLFNKREEELNKIYEQYKKYEKTI